MTWKTLFFLEVCCLIDSGDWLMMSPSFGFRFELSSQISSLSSRPHVPGKSRIQYRRVELSKNSLAFDGGIDWFMLILQSLLMRVVIDLSKKSRSENLTAGCGRIRGSIILSAWQSNLLKTRGKPLRTDLSEWLHSLQWTPSCMFCLSVCVLCAGLCPYNSFCVWNYSTISNVCVSVCHYIFYGLFMNPYQKRARVLRVNEVDHCCRWRMLQAKNNRGHNREMTKAVIRISAPWNPNAITCSCFCRNQQED